MLMMMMMMLRLLQSNDLALLGLSSLSVTVALSNDVTNKVTLCNVQQKILF